MRHIQSNGDPSQGSASERTPAQFCCPHCKAQIALGGGLSRRQRDVLTFIVAFIAEKQISPTIGEICVGVSSNSRSKVWQLVDQLCAKGFLAKLGGPQRHRNIIVTEAQIILDASKGQPDEHA